MHCDGSLPLSEPLSISPRLVLLARFAVTRGPAPWNPAEEHGPSDSRRVLRCRLAKQVAQRVRFLMRHTPLSE